MEQLIELISGINGEKDDEEKNLKSGMNFVVKLRVNPAYPESQSSVWTFHLARLPLAYFKSSADFANIIATDSDLLPYAPTLFWDISSRWANPVKVKLGKNT